MRRTSKYFARIFAVLAMFTALLAANSGASPASAATCYSQPTWWNMNWELTGSDAQMDWPNWSSSWFAPTHYAGQLMLNSDKPPAPNANEYAEAGWTARRAGNEHHGWARYGLAWSTNDIHALRTGQVLRLCGSTVY